MVRILINYLCIGEESANTFKTYHFDCRGSTVAITDASGAVTDTFAYDTYGKLLTRTGTSEVIFGYNGRDGIITEDTSLIYMRARYYSPDLRRFINADIIAGDISNASVGIDDGKSGDIYYAEKHKLDIYVVGPNLILQKYEPSSNTVWEVETISPKPLSDEQKKQLVSTFKESWEAHIKEGCNFRCGNMSWPTEQQKRP